MTSQGEILKQEIEEYTTKTGRYIPTYLMARYIAAANNVVNVLMKTFPSISYCEMKIILKIVDGAIRNRMRGCSNGAVSDTSRPC